MNKVFMTGYYQGVVEVAPASLSAAKVEELAVAMECRCYHGGEGRTRLRQLKYAGKDWAVLVFFLVIAVLVGVLGHFGL